MHNRICKGVEETEENLGLGCEDKEELLAKLLDEEEEARLEFAQKHSWFLTTSIPSFNLPGDLMKELLLIERGGDF